MFNTSKSLTDINPLFLIDFYKADHRSQYPDGTTLVYSNFTPRKSRVEGEDSMVFFGLQYIIEEYLVNRFNKNFFSKPLNDVVSEYENLMNNSLGKGCIKDFSHIVDLHNLGYLPIRIDALPEGTSVPMNVPAMTMWNTHPKFFWLTNYLETLVSSLLWKPCTSATTARYFKKYFDYHAANTSDIPEFTEFQGHDFSFRGMSGVEDAALSGAAHLLYFKGTDTVPAIGLLNHYYFGESVDMVGGSVPATEHSVMCAGGKDSELETLSRLLRIYPTGILSVVSDTWDLFKLINEYLPELKSTILNRDGKLVIRPDSGTPHKILNGDPDSDCELEKMGVFSLLDKHFGSTINSKGFKQLNPKIGVIYGDGIDRRELNNIMRGMVENGFSSTNIVIGLGSYTYQYVTRDTYGTVCKATYVEVNGVPRPIFKAPKTGAWKKSHKGLLSVNYNKDGKLEVNEDVCWSEQGGEMKPVFVGGSYRVNQTLHEIRKRVK